MYSDPARIFEEVEHAIGNESFSASLTCAVVGIPRPSVLWSRFNSSGHLQTDIVNNSVKYVIVETEESADQGLLLVRSKLTVLNLNKAEDELNYRCEGSSNVINLLDVESTSEALLTVQGICYSRLVRNFSDFTLLFFNLACFVHMVCVRVRVWFVCVCVCVCALIH